MIRGYYNGRTTIHRSDVELAEVVHEIPLTLELTHIPVTTVIVTNLKEQLGDVLLLPLRVPDASLCNGAQVDIGMHVPEDGLLPPHHHEVDVLLDQVVQPYDVISSLDLLEIRPHQFLEAFAPSEGRDDLANVDERSQGV